MEDRYSRQMVLPGFGPEGQAKLKEARVLVIGCGGLGCPVANQLVRSGVGHIGLADGDTVSLSNLHRQSLFNESHVGRPKAEVAKEVLKAANQDVHVEVIQQHVGLSNWSTWIPSYDVVLDCTDNFTARYLINDACVASNKPLVYGAANQLEGQVAVFNVKGSGHLRDVFPEPPKPGTVQNCEVAGVLGPVTGWIGNMMALETLKLLTDLGTLLTNQLCIVDGATATVRHMKFKPKAEPVTMDVHRGITWDEYHTHFSEHPLIDVRSSQERGSSDVGTHMPFPVEDKALRKLDGQVLVFYCETGIRAEKTLHQFQASGNNEGYFIAQSLT